MPKDGYTLETLVYNSDEALRNNINTVEAQERYLRSTLPVPQETPEQLRAVLDIMFPGQNLIISDPAEIRERRLNHLNTFDTYIRLAAEYGVVKHHGKTPRHLAPLYKFETDQAAIDYNDHLRNAFAEGNYKEVGRLYAEHIMNLPSVDPGMIENLSSAEVPGMLRELYPLYVAITESKLFLKDPDPGTMAIKSGMSEESLARLKELSKLDTLFTVMKTRCDEMFSPYYIHMDTSKLACTQKNYDALSSPPAGLIWDLSQHFEKLGSNILFASNGFGDNTLRLLENAGLDVEKAVALDFYGKTYPVSGKDGYDCGEVYMRGEPVFCTVGDQLKAFKAVGWNVVEMQPEEALDSCFKTTLTTVIKDTDKLMNGKIAAPRWMLTGSTEYRNMQKAYANYQKAVGGEPTAEKLGQAEAKNALDALLPAATNYFTLKGVSLGDYPNYMTFARSWPEKMSERELARMKSAYDVLDTYNRTTQALKTHEGLTKYPSYKTPLPVKAPYLKQMKEDNEKISKSAFLNTPVAAIGNNNVGETLRQEVKLALTGPLNGLLNKKFFTAQDRQLAEDVLAKAVILSMITTGRMAAAPSAIETSYMDNAATTIDKIKKSEAFQNAKGKFLSPDSLRDFLIKNRQAEVNKSISKSAVEQKGAANAGMQNQPKLQNNVVQQNRPEPPKVNGPGMRGMGG